MNVILRKAKIIDAKSAFHNQIMDVEIADGIFKNIGTNLENKDSFKEIELANLHISAGWFDSSVCFGEPGFEDRETIANGLNVAAKSGFTGVALQPNSTPIIDNQSQINFVKSKANGFATELFPIGALTKNSEGKDLAELFDMKNAGAIAFGDYTKNIDNANLLKIARTKHQRLRRG
jgi:dihydroorotase